MNERPRLVALFALGMLSIMNAVAVAASIHRYDALTGTQRCAIAALPDGRYLLGALASDGAGPELEGKNALVIVGKDGEVETARNVGKFRIIFVATGPAGEMFAGVGLLPPAPEEEQFLRVVKLRPDFSVAWARRIVAPNGHPIGFSRATGTRDGGIVLAGVYDTAASVIAKLDAQGELEWTTRIDPSDEDAITSISQARDGGYVAAGRSPRWPWLIRLAPDGGVVWQTAYGPRQGELVGAVETNDGAIVALGNRLTKPLIMKTDASGRIAWSRDLTASGDSLSLVRAATESLRPPSRSRYGSFPCPVMARFNGAAHFRSPTAISSRGEPKACCSPGTKIVWRLVSRRRRHVF